MHQTVRDLLGTISGKLPLLVFIDDVHWADSSTLDLIKSISAPPSAPGLALVLTARTEDSSTGSQLASVIGELSRLHHFNSMHLVNLDLADARELVTGIWATATDDDIEQVSVLAGGNPLFIKELARHWNEVAGDGRSLPGSLKQTIGATFNSVSRPSLEFLGLTALIGMELDAVTLSAVTAEAQVVDADRLLSESLEAGVLVPGTTPVEYRFTNPLVRELLIERIPVAQLPELHASVGRAPQTELENGAGVPASAVVHTGKPATRQSGWARP